MNEIKTDCKKCNSWYNSCAPDDYPDYIDDPKHCKEFEAKKEFKNKKVVSRILNNAGKGGLF